MDSIISQYLSVLQGTFNMDQIRGVVRNLNQDVATNSFFTDSVLSLEPISMDEAGRIALGYKGRSRNEVPIEPIGVGAYGKIYKNRAGTVIYKKLEIQGIPQLVELITRMTFLEVFIQTVLGMDPEYGIHICKVSRLYRDIATRRTRDGTLENVILYIVMEPIARTLNEQMELLVEDDRVPLDGVAPYFAQLGKLLYSLQRKFAFAHHDLHIGNILMKPATAAATATAISGGGSAATAITGPTAPPVASPHDIIVLIDFGMSCVTIEGITYALHEGNILPANAKALIPSAVGKPCESYDLPMFLVSFAESYGVTMSDEDNVKLSSLFDTRAEKFNLLGWLFERYGELEDPPSSIFKMLYHDDIRKYLPDDILHKMGTMLRLRPLEFAQLFDPSFAPRMGGGKRSRKHQTSKARTRNQSRKRQKRRYWKK